MKHFLSIILGLVIALILFLSGFYFGKSNRSYQVDVMSEKIKRSFTGKVADAVNLSGRKLVLLEYPELINRIMEGGSFGNENFSIATAQNMFSRDEEAISDIIDKMEITKVADNIWIIRLPLVNCTLIETEEGLVLIDTGMKPAGPALLNAIRSISEKPVHTILYTHGHVDHCYGTWALIEAGETPQIIGHSSIRERYHRYIQLGGSIAKYMSQPESQLPKDSSDIVWPNRYFDDFLELKIGGITFQLYHFEGETDDQFFVWMPEERALLAADYYQGFLPNAGNGKRVQRNVGEWIAALEKMQQLQPELFIPSHGPHIEGTKNINESLHILIEAMTSILDQTIDGLNAGLRKDQVFKSVELPEHLKSHPTLEEKYVTAQDISKMIIKQYTGWWDDIPSHWSPAPLELQARQIANLAGGSDALVNYTRELMKSDLKLASHFCDWAWLAHPENEGVQQLVLDVYRQRIMADGSVTQEMLVYLDHMAAVRETIN